MEKPNTRPWWRDPTWLTAAALCGLVLASAYLYSRFQTQRDAIRIQAHIIRLQGDLFMEDRPSEALDYYQKAIRLIQERGNGDPRLQVEQAEAQAKIDQIRRTVKDGTIR